MKHDCNWRLNVILALFIPLLCCCVSEQEQRRRTIEANRIAHTEGNKSKIARIPKLEDMDLLQEYGSLRGIKMLEHEWDADYINELDAEINRRKLLTPQEYDDVVNRRPVKVGDSLYVICAGNGRPRKVRSYESDSGSMLALEYWRPLGAITFYVGKDGVVHSIAQR